MWKTHLAVLGSAAGKTNASLVSAWRRCGLACSLLEPGTAGLAAYDVVLARLDVLPTLDGVEPGLLQLLWLERRGAKVFNTCGTLLTTHDKLRTAVALRRAGLPHPQTLHLDPGRSQPPPAPVVLKPRFGSWGRDVRLCRRDAEVASSLAEFASRPWFRRHGVLAQAVLPTRGFDLRLLVAGGRVVGAVERHARSGEWRTNVSVGAERLATTPDAEASALAVAAATAVGADLVGVDLMPLPDGGYAVIELNGAVDFTQEYSLDGDIYEAVADALGVANGDRLRRRSPARVGGSRHL